MSRTHDVIHILSLKPDIDFCHLFIFVQSLLVSFLCIGKKSAFWCLKTDKCLDATRNLGYGWWGQSRSVRPFAPRFTTRKEVVTLLLLLPRIVSAL